MNLEDFVKNYRIATGNSYWVRVEDAQLFIEDAETEKVNATFQQIVRTAAAYYDVDANDL